jgi:hypothetical protein
MAAVTRKTSSRFDFFVFIKNSIPAALQSAAHTVVKSTF